MTILKAFFVIVFLTTAGAAYACGGGCKACQSKCSCGSGGSCADAQAGAATGTGDIAANLEVGNTICPVTGEKIPASDEKNGMQVYKHEYNGKLYTLCCATCVSDFNKDPQKYSKLAEDQVVENK